MNCPLNWGNYIMKRFMGRRGGIVEWFIASAKIKGFGFRFLPPDRSPSLKLNSDWYC